MYLQAHLSELICFLQFHFLGNTHWPIKHQTKKYSAPSLLCNSEDSHDGRRTSEHLLDIKIGIYSELLTWPGCWIRMLQHPLPLQILLRAPLHLTGNILYSIMSAENPDYYYICILATTLSTILALLQHCWTRTEIEVVGLCYSVSPHVCPDDTDMISQLTTTQLLQRPSSHNSHIPGR